MSERLYMVDDERYGVTAHEDPDVRRRHRRRYSRGIAAIMNARGDRGGIWVDAGCGSGYGTEMIAAVADSVVGIDHDHEAIDVADRNYSDHPGVSFRVAGLCSFVVRGRHETGVADAIVAVEAIEHLACENHPRAIARFDYNLKDGGHLFLAFPLGEDKPSDVNEYHLCEPSEARIRSIVAARGFEVLSFETEDYTSTYGPATQAYLLAEKRRA